jgi:hypothetical protein
VQIYPKLVPVQNEISGPDGGALVTTINLVPLAGVGS